MKTDNNCYPVFYTPNGAVLDRIAVYFSSNGSIGSGGDFELQLYHGGTLPAGTTSPPGSSTEILSSDISVPDVNSESTQSVLTSFSVGTIPADQWVYLSIKSGSVFPPSEANLSLVIVYTEAQT